MSYNPLAKKYNIKHDICGKVVVAVNPEEEERLDKICETGNANGLEGIEKIDAVRLKEIEPYVEGVAALWVPESGIIDFVGVTNKLAELIKEIKFFLQDLSLVQKISIYQPILEDC